jgi:hypothetical protein
MRGFFGKVRSGEELIAPLDSNDPAWWPDAPAFMLRIGARQCVSLLILLRGEVVGLLTLWLPHETAGTGASRSCGLPCRPRCH